MFFLMMLLLCTAQYSHAGLLLEPVLGYSSGEILDNDEMAKDSLSGLSYGGRIGYQHSQYQIGFDYLRSSYQVDEMDDFSSQEAGIFVAYISPENHVRAYLGYMIYSAIKFSASANVEVDGNNVYVDFDAKTTKGSGFKVGVGYTGLPYVNINLEYRRSTFSEYEIEALGQSLSTSADWELGVGMISVSAPFEL